MIDPAGNVTTWARDLQGRVTGKTLADGAQTRYVYENTAGRLKQVIDAKGQAANYLYAIDDNLQQISFTRPRTISQRPKISRPISRTRGIQRPGSASQDPAPASARTEAEAQEEAEEAGLLDAITSTPTVNLIYDQNYDRLASFEDGAGKTTYSYHPAGRPGALQLAAVDGPLDNDTVTYSYDELGRLVSRDVNGVTSSWTFDALGRMTSVINPLGRFTSTYVGITNRLSALRYPNGQMTTFSYFGNTGDQRLQQIKHQNANQGLLSQFDYTYLATGEIQSIARQIPRLAPGQSAFNFSYDLASQLTNAAATGGANPSSFAYAHDPAGNRTMEQIDSVIASSSFNNTNQLVAQERGGATRRFTYDMNGNLNSDGTRSFEWDALDRLIAITMGGRRTEFSYDGLDRRTRIVEKENDVVVSDKRFVWCGDEICEERVIVGASSAVTKRFFEQGETQMVGGIEAAYFYTRDHLGSVREMTDNRGAIVASYEYDPFGQMSKVGGDKDAAFGYADYFVHAPSGLNLTLYRAYDANLGRWLSRDPAGESEGPNLYEYVANDPVNLLDPSGGSLVSWLGGRAVKQGTKQFLRHYLRNQVRDRLRRITANKTRQEIAKELQDITDILDSDSVADVIIEIIPGVGDIYGAARFCGKLQQAFKRAKALDDRVDGLLAPKQLFPKFSTRKRLIDAPKTVGTFKDPRRKMKDKRPESHKGGSLHVHDKYHNSGYRANVHYCLR